MKGSRLIGAAVMGFTLLTSGCMMMHSGDIMGHGSDHQTQKNDKVSEEEIEHEKSEPAAEAPFHSEHTKGSAPQEEAIPWLIWGGIGMGLMMVLMFI